jgi:Fic family protein
VPGATLRGASADGSGLGDRARGRCRLSAPEAGEARSLVSELSRWLEDAGLPPVIRAAMAHLHLVSIHPFADGDGRISRIVQSLVLARDGVLAPELGSIEEYLGAHTAEYYAVLQEVQGGSWQPQRDAGPWVRFCLEAHRAQVLDRIRTVERAAARWDILEALVRNRGWPERLAIALEQALSGATDRATYAAEAGVSPATASADLRRLVDGRILDRAGTTRDAHYVATDVLRRMIS